MRNIFILLFVILLTGCANRVQRNQYDSSLPANQRNYIIYIEKLPISWYDFKAKPDSNSSKEVMIDVTTVVTQKTNIWWGYDYLEIHGVFFPDNSWIKDGYKTANTLKYVQLFHKIAELYARKFYAYLDSNNIKPNNLQPHKGVFDNINNQLKEYLKEYEDETKAGRDSVKLMIWIDKVNKEYSKYPSNGS